MHPIRPMFKADVSHQEKPLAAKGLISYRYPSSGGQFVMIGARDDNDAVREANRSLSYKTATLEHLETWSGTQYVNVAATTKRITM